MTAIQFAENLKAFYAKEPERRIKVNGKAISDPGGAFESSLSRVCDSADLLGRHPHLIHACCQMSAPGRAELCLRLNAGMGLPRETMASLYDVRLHHKTIVATAEAACKDPSFNRANADQCCASPGILLGWTGDSDDVARACGLPRL